MGEDQIAAGASAVLITAIFLLALGYVLLGERKSKKQKGGSGTMTRQERKAFVKRAVSDAISEAFDKITALQGESTNEKLTVDEAHHWRRTIGIRCDLTDVCPRLSLTADVRQQLSGNIRTTEEGPLHVDPPKDGVDFVRIPI